MLSRPQAGPPQERLRPHSRLAAAVTVPEGTCNTPPGLGHSPRRSAKSHHRRARQSRRMVGSRYSPRRCRRGRLWRKSKTKLVVAWPSRYERPQPAPRLTLHARRPRAGAAIPRPGRRANSRSATSPPHAGFSSALRRPAWRKSVMELATTYDPNELGKLGAFGPGPTSRPPAPVSQGARAGRGRRGERLRRLASPVNCLARPAAADGGTRQTNSSTKRDREVTLCASRQQTLSAFPPSR